MSEPCFRHGDIVVRRNRRDERGVVQGAAIKLAGRFYYRVLFPSSSIPVQVPENDLVEVRLAASVDEMLLNGEFGDQSTVSRLLTYERLRRPLQDTLYAFRASRTEFQPYQFKPLLKFLRSAKQRLLLADEVGLGKTIEAGFILCELLARYPHTFHRTLVVCKASLCTKWQMELRRRFDLQFDIWKAPQLLDFVQRYRDEDAEDLRTICSLESFRNTKVMEEWEAMPPPLDLLIIDEAHHLKNSETKAHRACREAAASADAVLALTATPIQIGSRDLYNLLSLLDEEEFSSFPYFEACMLFNRHIVAAEQKVSQTAENRFKLARDILLALGEEHGYLQRDALQETNIRSSTSELALAWAAVSTALRSHPLYAETLRLLAEANPHSRRVTIDIQRNFAEMNLLSRVFSRTRRRDVHIGSERVAVIKRVALTTAERGFYDAVLEFVRSMYLKGGKNTALLFGLMMPQRQLASCIPAMVEYYEMQVENRGGLDEEVSDADAEDWNRDDSDDAELRRQELRQIIQTWYQVGQPDSKFAVLRCCLEELQHSQPGEPIIIFSYFKKTVEYLSRKLGALGYSNTVISGAFSPAEREERISQFREGKFQVLLSTEVGSEGLDFQFCHILFNYDLPWNPMVVEQRIGRLDRFGQKAKRILIFNLSAPGTIEDEILTRLYRRINLFESYIGDLEAILGNEISNLTKDLFDPELTEEQRRLRIEQAALVLEKRKQQFEEWEKSSPQFIGHDEYYRQEIDRAQKLGRFIAPTDLALLVADFLHHFDRRLDLDPDPEEDGVYRLGANEKLLSFVIDQPEDQQKTAFCSALHRSFVRVTFDSEVAERDSSLTYLHVRHFFIRAIVNAHEDTTFHPVARLALARSDDLRAGDYLYLIARTTILAAREQEALLAALVNLEDFAAVSEEASELVLGRMVRNGSDTPVPSVDCESLRTAYSAAEAVLAERFQARRLNVERLNDAFVDSRLASVRESHRMRISRKQILLDNARLRNQPTRYIRMLEGTIRNLKAEQQKREEQIEALRTVTAEYSPIASGVLVVS